MTHLEKIEAQLYQDGFTRDYVDGYMAGVKATREEIQALWPRGEKLYSESVEELWKEMNPNFKDLSERIRKLRDDGRNG